MKIKKSYLYILFFVIIVISAGFLLYKTNVSTSTSNKITNMNLEKKFVLLSNAKTNFCANANFINFKSDDERLQGSCCSKMDFHRYKEQVERLKKYSNIDKIPKDPYDIPISLAKELLMYKKEIKLTSEQQMIYDEAMKMSHEGGPCCCKCWRWDAFEGLAKFLITEYGFNSGQVAEVWDLVDGCGGKGHAHENQHNL